MNQAHPSPGQTRIRQSEIRIYRNWLSDAMTKPKQRNSVVLRLIELSRERQAEFEELKQILGPNGLGLLDNIRIRTTEDAGG